MRGTWRDSECWLPDEGEIVDGKTQQGEDPYIRTSDYPELLNDMGWFVEGDFTIHEVTVNVADDENVSDSFGLKWVGYPQPDIEKTNKSAYCPQKEVKERNSFYWQKSSDTKTKEKDHESQEFSLFSASINKHSVSVYNTTANKSGSLIRTERYAHHGTGWISDCGEPAKFYNHTL